MSDINDAVANGYRAEEPPVKTYKTNYFVVHKNEMIAYSYHFETRVASKLIKREDFQEYKETLQKIV